MSRSRQRPDHYAHKAKQQGFAARSVYKLEEIDQRWRILHPGARVLDLGCSPGSWMQYAAKRVGPSGRVLGFDLQPVRVALPAWAQAEVGDVYQLELSDTFDVVLSDMAPATMGNRLTDSTRSAALAEHALHLASLHLAAGGTVVVKLLEGGDVPAIVSAMRGQYERVERLRPKATRKDSTEIFLVGLGWRG